MNHKIFSPLEQKGIAESNSRIIKNIFYSEGNGTDLEIKNQPEYKEISTLADYFKLLDEIHRENEERLRLDKNNCGSLFLYRGQGNINFNYCPSILRKQTSIKNEHRINREFHRRFYNVFDNCRTMLEEEVLMQHFGIGSRCLDLMENPLIALWAACEIDSDKNFNNTFGEVSFWCLDNNSDDLKAYDSSTVSVIANTAKCGEEFCLGNVEIEYRKEHPFEMDDFIYIRDILRRSVIVRPKYNNQRIINQQGAFAIMNLNRLIDKNGDFKRKFKVTVEEFSDYIMNAEKQFSDKDYEYKYPNLMRLREGKHTLKKADFRNLYRWDICFRKITPDEASYVDSFDLYRYMYHRRNTKDGVRRPIYAVIAPKNKERILRELSYMNITKAYIYPEMESVAKELKEQFTDEKANVN